MGRPAPSNNALYAFGTRRSRLPGSPVSRRYRVGAHDPVRARYFAQVLGARGTRPPGATAAR
eukprot:2149803-Rhodomonas_salina.1